MQRWDIFCKVVDNFGDIGVCWRLACQLADEHGIHIALWVDDIVLARRFAGAGHPHVNLLHWTEDADFAGIGPVVIETFGCGLPDACQQVMQSPSSVWVNIDYLSAEPWVEGFHAQPSPQSNGLVRYFFYPGFTQHTGGLLREAGLPALQEKTQWVDLQLTPTDDALTVSLFCYAHAPLAGFVQSLEASSRPVRVLVPHTIAPMLADKLKISALQVGDIVRLSQCEFQVIPFLSQADYDRLLHLCDLNFVRGEDSWVRALWAGKPMIWQPYQQSENTHLVKLNAFLDHYLAEAEERVSTTVRNAMLAWAQGQWQAHHWQALQEALPSINTHARAYAERQSRHMDLATNLVIFIEKCRRHRV